MAENGTGAKKGFLGKLFGGKGSKSSDKLKKTTPNDKPTEKEAEGKSSGKSGNNPEEGGQEKGKAKEAALPGQEEREEEEIKAPVSKEPIVIGSIQDLPPQWMDTIKHNDVPLSDLEDPQKFLILLIIMQFLSKQPVIQKEEDGNLKELFKQPVSKLDEAKLPTMDSVVKGSDRLLLKKEYKMTEKLVGTGGFGRVYEGKKVTKPTGRVAVKRMPNVERRNQINNLSEIYFLRIVDHPNIVKYDCCWRIDDELWLFMEFMEGGTLREAVLKFQKFNEKQIAYVAYEMLQGLKYLHSLNLIHRDLKSYNIMMSVQGDIKLIDFGLCIEVTPEEMKEEKVQGMVGSPCWIPPEMIKREPYGSKVDIWSLGICLLELAEGKAPNQNKGALAAMYTTGTFLNNILSITPEHIE